MATEEEEKKNLFVLADFFNPEGSEYASINPNI